MKQQNVTRCGFVIGGHKTAATGEAGKRLQFTHFQGIADGDAGGMPHLGQGHRQHPDTIEASGGVAAMHAKPRAYQRGGGLGQRGS